MESGRKRTPLLSSIIFVIAACTGVAAEGAETHSERAISLEANHQTITPSTDQLTLTCTIDSTDEDIHLNIVRDGIHTMGTIDTYTGIQSDFQENVQAEGNIIDQSRDFFLKVMIDDIGETEAGTYSCTCFVENQESGKVDTIVQWRADQDVMSKLATVMDNVKLLETELDDQRIENQDMKLQLETVTDDFKSLKTELDNQRTENQHLTLELKRFVYEVSTLEKDLDAKNIDHERQLKQLKTENENVTSELKTLVDKVLTLEKDLDFNYIDLENQGTYFKSKLQRFKNDISSLKAELFPVTEHQRKQMVIEPPAKIVFSAKTVEYNKKKVNGIMKFRTLMLNKGDHYNKTTGMFRVPKKGIYVFHLTVTTKRIQNGKTSSFKLRVNNLAEESIKLKSYESSAMSIVRQLIPGDDVKLTFMVQALSNHGFIESAQFSGYLLTAL